MYALEIQIQACSYFFCLNCGFAHNETPRHLALLTYYITAATTTWQQATVGGSYQFERGEWCGVNSLWELLHSSSHLCVLDKPLSELRFRSDFLRKYTLKLSVIKQAVSVFTSIIAGNTSLFCDAPRFKMVQGYENRT